MTLGRAPGYVAITAIILSVAVFANVGSAMAAVTPSAGDNALQLLVIELFFLLVGLAVIAFVGFLIWQSWRQKKKKATEKKN